jgi:type II secretory ATPase GspE/PulE/Tfp pilus assembly ATPase PilB-like protein
MVGEIRDRETAEIAIQAALTGHLVLSTLHTNDASSAITRLIDMGAEPFLISSSVIGILAQRLVRILCKDCKEEYTPSPEALKDIGMPKGETKFYRGKGCAKCANTGYKGRIGIYELLIPDPKIRGLTLAKAPVEEIRKQAQATGMKTLKEDGIQKIRDGVTTIEEVLRVTAQEERG